MAQIELFTFVAAPVARCFDLARSVDFHVHAATASAERAVDGRRSGLMEFGDQVTWEARHFGIRQRLSVRMTAFDRPNRFEDTMIHGAFTSLRHDHLFQEQGDGTLMRDVFQFAAPLGPIGRLADLLFLSAYMRRFLLRRNRRLKTAAESDEWREFLPHVI